MKMAFIVRENNMVLYGKYIVNQKEVVFMTKFEQQWMKTLSYEISNITKRIEARQNRYNNDDYYNSYEYQKTAPHKRIDDLKELDLLVNAYTNLKNACLLDNYKGETESQ